MSSERTELRIVRGETRTLRLVVTDEDGEFVDLTGAIVYFRVKTAVSAADPALIEKDSGTVAEIEILTPQATTGNKGRADIKLVPSDTSALTAPQTYVYDAWVVLASGARHPVVKPSKFYLERAVTELP